MACRYVGAEFPASERRAIYTCGLGPDCVDAREAAANSRKSLISDGLVEPKTRSPPNLVRPKFSTDVATISSAYRVPYGLIAKDRQKGRDPEPLPASCAPQIFSAPMFTMDRGMFE